MPKLCPNIRFPHQQSFFPHKERYEIFDGKIFAEKFKIFVQDFVPIRTALTL